VSAVEATNRQFRLAGRPEGLPGRDAWDLTEEPAREPAEGEALVKVSMLSLDPAMRGWMRDVPSYVPPVGIGEVMRAIGVGQVVASRNEKIEEGQYVTGLFGIQEYATLSGDALTPVDTELAPIATYLNVLGMPGMTAYFGLLDVGEPQPGDTVVVSGAAGAVGATVGQIAKIKGCRAVGIAGGPEKCRMLIDEFGYDAAIDYKSEELVPALREKCPDRVNVYFDNVGGEVLDAALARLARGARVVICGAVSQYNESSMRGPSNYMSLLVRRARMQGFVVFDYAARYEEAAREMAGWMAEGKLVGREDVVTGIETFPETLNKLFRGENTGKLILQVAETA
jgi:NADPH-dependent curcumin reductase CurA